MKFVDLFAGLGGFHLALRSLGHECVFASEIDEELRELYKKNFPKARRRTVGDIRKYRDRIPKHDILCAGFPCQPFSKSGTQKGLRDKTRGTLFHEVAYVIRKYRPRYVILENVGNFERHDQGRTWAIVRQTLEEMEYNVRGTEHVASGGHGLVSPHHLGYPQTRERFFAVASLEPIPGDPFPREGHGDDTSLADIAQSKTELDRIDREETAIGEDRVKCIDHWNALLDVLPEEIALPSFPMWGDEIYARYPFAQRAPHSFAASELLGYLGRNGPWLLRPKREVLALLPSYARTKVRSFPDWKVAFIRQNRRWFREIQSHFPEGWVRELRQFLPSHRKLEWNCQGEERDLWKLVLQFRPSGLRAKRYTTCPSLVAMTTTQIPILGPKRRHLTNIEGLRLQGFPDGHRLPETRGDAFRALGNAVHVGVARAIARGALNRATR